jgi:hypothetical protein
LAPALAIRCGQRAAPSGGVPLTCHLCCVNCWVALEESVELAGDIADHTASDLAVGLALGPSPLGIGAGRRVIAQPGQDDQVQGLVELAVPGAIEPHPDGLALEAGMGAAPASMAKAASLAQRPGWDQAHSTMAATIGPTPQRPSRSGRQARTRVVMARVWSAISAFRSWMRRATVRKLAAVALVSTSRWPAAGAARRW